MVWGKVPRGFHEGSTRVLAGFHQFLRGLRGGLGWFEEGSTRVPPGFQQSSTNFFEGCGVVWGGLREVPRGFHTRVPPEFHQVWRGLRGGPRLRQVSPSVPSEFHLRSGPGWLEVRLHEGVSGFHEAAQGFHKAPQGSTRVPEMFCKVPWFAPEGSCVSCARRLKSHRILEGSEDRFAHGRNTKKKQNQWFLAHVHCFVTCSLAQATRPEMLALWQIRAVLRGGLWVPRMTMG